MPSLDLRRNDIVIGVDTHKDEHIAVALDGIGGNRGSHALPATPEGYAGMLSWAQDQGRVVAFGVEGTGSYGSGLARFLRRHGATVYEVSRPPRRGERRASGKSDLVDAEHAARQQAAFAKLCGVCPIPASSGRTTGRHRLNRGGNRQANAALYRIVIVRLRWHQPTIDYVARRTTEGLTKKEIIRCLKRYVAREVYLLLPTPANQASQNLVRAA